MISPSSILTWLLGRDRVTTTVCSSGVSTVSMTSSLAFSPFVQASEFTRSRLNLTSWAVKSAPSEKGNAALEMERVRCPVVTDVP